MAYNADTNRFTIADYTYDRDRDRDQYEAEPEAESSSAAMARAAYDNLSPVVEGSGASSSVSPPVAVYRPKVQRQPTDGVPISASGGTLKLHDYPPTSPPRRPSTSPTSLTIPQLSPDHSYSSTQPLNLRPESAMSEDRITLDEERDLEHGGDRRSIYSDMSEKHAHAHAQTAYDQPKTPNTGLARMTTTTRNKSLWRRIIPSTTLTKCLLGTILIETVINLAIEVYLYIRGNILYRFNEEVESTTSTDLEWENRRRLPIYLIIFGLAHLWQIVLTVIAIRTKNTIQVMSVTAFNFAFLGYAVIQIYELRKVLGDNLANELTGNEGDITLMTIPLNVLTALIIAVVALSCLILTGLSFYLQREFGWQRYRFLGADLMIREYYTKLQVFECICYFSAFFCAGFGIQFIWLVLNPDDVEYIITWIAFPLLLVFLVIGRFAAKYENRYMMAAFMVGLVAGCAYFIFKLARIWQQDDTTYRTLAKSLTTFDALSIVSLLACAVWGVMVWLNFGKGLKQALLARPGTISSIVGMWRSNSNETQEKDQEMVMAQRRISID